jgi:acetyl-CoA C-acetyltransferase
MQDVVILEAVRSPIGRRKGGLAGLHPAELLGAVQRAAIERARIDPGAVGQIIAGCVSQVGEQSFNVGRTAWLALGYPMEVPATSIDSQCGSSQQATTLAAGLVGGGIESLVLASGVEMMTRVPLGSNMQGGRPLPPTYREHYAFASQFQGAEMIAKEYGITREDADRFGLESQRRAARAWAEGRFTREVMPIDAPVLDDSGQPTGERRRVERDEGIRETSLEKLAALKPVEPGGIHTAGTSSQVSDGAAAVLVASPARARELGARPRARVLATTLVGVDPVTMLKGPIPASRKVLAETGLSVGDMDVFEVNEAFASVVLAWMKELRPDPAKVNPNGGAIALGHPTGSTGARLITTALHELERTKGRYALIAMCCGGGLGTGTIIERL